MPDVVVPIHLVKGHTAEAISRVSTETLSPTVSHAVVGTVAQVAALAAIGSDPKVIIGLLLVGEIITAPQTQVLVNSVHEIRTRTELRKIVLTDPHSWSESITPGDLVQIVSGSSPSPNVDCGLRSLTDEIGLRESRDVAHVLASNSIAVRKQRGSVGIPP